MARCLSYWFDITMETTVCSLATEDVQCRTEMSLTTVIEHSRSQTHSFICDLLSGVNVKYAYHRKASIMKVRKEYEPLNGHQRVTCTVHTRGNTVRCAYEISCNLTNYRKHIAVDIFDLTSFNLTLVSLNVFYFPIVFFVVFLHI